MTQQSASLTPIAVSAAWDEDEWAGKIAEDKLLLDTIAALQAAVTAFEQNATKQEANNLAEIRVWFKETHSLAKEKHAQKQGASDEPSSFRQRFRRARAATSATVLQYCAHVDFIAGVCPNYVQAVWGSVRLLLVAETNHSKLRSSVEQNLIGMSNKFALIETLTVYVPTGQMVKALTSAYSAYGRFLEKAVKYYGENRFKTSLNAFARPWEQRFQPAVDNVTEAIANVLQVAQVFSIGTLGKILRVAERLEHLIDGEYIRLSDSAVTQQTHDTLRDKLHERISEESLATSQIPTKTLNEASLNSIKDLFPSLAEIEKRAQACQSISEHFMAEEDVKQMFSSTQNVDKIVSWLESASSQVLWIDGGSNLSNLEWNSRFALPILRDVRNHFRSVTIVRYFAAEYGRSNPSNDSRTLVQSFLAQLMSNHQASLSNLDKDRLTSATSDFKLLWDIFLECLDTIELQCIVIVIDSIDSLYDRVSAVQASDIEMLVIALNGLAASSSVTAKILLTTNFQPTSNLASLKQSQALVLARPSRKSNGNVADSNNQLVALKMQEIATDRCHKVTFLSAYLLYFPDTVIFVGTGDGQQCYVVSEVSGMETRGPGKYGPLKLRCRFVDHDGTSVCFKYREFSIHQFAGEKDVAELECIPSGWLPNEAERREFLIKRGMKYWDLSYGKHYQTSWPDQRSEDGFDMQKSPKAAKKVMIDQRRAKRLPGTSNVRYANEDGDSVETIRIEYTSLPGTLVFLICSAMIPAYMFDKLTWELTEVASLASVNDEPRRLESIIVDTGIRRSCESLITQRARMKPRDAHTSMMVLLYGPAHVGKSSLIEAICESKSVPLIKLNAVDFDSVLPVLEHELLELAVAWSAVVHLNDPERFFPDNTSSTQAVTALHQNLETHPATVFFTTNSVSVLDQRFVSRIDLAFEFPPLPSRSHPKIWKEQILHLMDARRAQEWCHEDIWETLTANFSDENLNGRQVAQLANMLYSICAPQLRDPDLSRSERLDIMIGELNRLCRSQLKFQKMFASASQGIEPSTRSLGVDKSIR